MTSPIEFRAGPPTESPASELLAEMVAEMRALYRITGPDVGVPLEPAELAPPGGVYLVGWSGPDAAAGGGARLLTPRIAEIKRMYVRPAFRGQGLGRFLLAALEDESARLGADTIRLDTGSRQPAAIHLYEQSGYRKIDDYNHNPHAAFWAEKHLA